MTLFKVLSAEEAEKAVRWKAPNISASTANIIHAKSPVSPLSHSSLQELAKAHALISLPQTSDNNATMETSAPALQAAQSQEKESLSTSPSLEQPTVGMLQSSYNEGYSQGYVDGTKALKDTHIAELAALISSMRRESESIVQEPVEKEVYALAIDIARVLLQREIELVPDTLAQLVKRGLEQLPSVNGGVKQVYLNPADLDIVQHELELKPEISLFPDDQLARGECRLQSQSSTVHAGLENWLEAMAVELGLLSSSSILDATGLSAENASVE